MNVSRVLRNLLLIYSATIFIGVYMHKSRWLPCFFICNASSLSEKFVEKETWREVSNERSYPPSLPLFFSIFYTLFLCAMNPWDKIECCFSYLALSATLKSVFASSKHCIFIHSPFRTISRITLSQHPSPHHVIYVKNQKEMKNLKPAREGNFFFAFSMPGSSLMMIFDIFSFYIRLISSANEFSTFSFLPSLFSNGAELLKRNVERNTSRPALRERLNAEAEISS